MYYCCYLVENNPGIFIHPVIEKYSFNTTHEELVKNRQNSLNKFLSQITTHPVLKKDPVIEKFFSDNKFNEKVNNIYIYIVFVK